MSMLRASLASSLVALLVTMSGCAGESPEEVETPKAPGLAVPSGEVAPRFVDQVEDAVDDSAGNRCVKYVPIFVAGAYMGMAKILDKADGEQWDWGPFAMACSNGRVVCVNCN